MRLALIAALALTTAAFGQAPAEPPAAETPAARELKRLQGFWKPESCRHDGAELLSDARQRALLTLVIKGAEYRMYVASDPAKDEHVRLFTADVKLDPAGGNIDLSVKQGHKQGETMHGIYEITKDNQLRLCYGPAAAPRPAKFEAEKGAGTFLEVWGKEK